MNTDPAFGFCQCGCGQPTRIATKTDRSTNRIKGQPMRYVNGHVNRKHPIKPEPNTTKRCECGCGQLTQLAQITKASAGHVQGQPQRYVLGHNNRGPWLTAKEDHGHNTPCDMWQRQLTADGYGVRIGIDGQYHQPHRIAWERKNGPIAEDMQLDHLCRNRACVNPDHLEPVSNAENCRRGNATKLTKDQVRAIRASDESNQVLANRYGVDRTNISMIRRRKSWTVEMEDSSPDS